MKFLVLILVIGVVIWLLRSSARRRATVAPEPEVKSLQMIVPCAHCGVHLPRHQAVPGVDGALFCTEAHRRAHERIEG